MLTRRRFLAASSALAAAPFVRVRAADEPMEKLRVAVIGVAGQGGYSLNGVSKENMVALCDVDESRAGKARGQFPQAKFFTDYRRMFDQLGKDLDAVCVCTPDHTHAHATLAALRLGKHVYCEKPLARTVEEVRLMQEIAAQNKCITQMGTQIHAGDNYRRVVEIVQAGIIGPVNRVHVWLGSGPQPGKRTPSSPIKFDLDVWRGPVAEEFFHADHPTSPYRKGNPWPHFHWRYWWTYGGGQLADFGCHYMDLPFWALGLGAPATVKATGSPMSGADNDVPGRMQVDYRIPGKGKQPAVHLTWYHGVPGPDLSGKVRYEGFGSGVLFEGEKGKLLADYGKHRLLPDEFARSVTPPPQSIPKSAGHHQEWLNAIRTGGLPLCHFGYAGPLTETVLLGNVAYRSGQELKWDTRTGTVTNAPEAMRYVRCEARKGWELT